MASQLLKQKKNCVPNKQHAIAYQKRKIYLILVSQAVKYKSNTEKKPQKLQLNSLCETVGFNLLKLLFNNTCKDF